MKQQEISVYLIAKTQVQHNEVEHWLTDKKVEYNYTKEAAPGATLTTLAGKRCYNAFDVGEANLNLTRVRQDMADFCDNVLKQSHGSVLEHTSYTFAIEGITRVATAELNRHRAGMAVSEGSGRYIRPSEFSYWLPLSIREQGFDEFCNERGVTYENAIEGQYDKLHEEWSEVEYNKYLTRQLFIKAFNQMAENYAELESIWEIGAVTDFHTKKQLTSLFRRVLGQGISTGGVWTGNLRALRHIFTMRCDQAAEEEICHVATLMLKKMMIAEPEIFGDFKQVDGFWQPTYRKV